MATTGSKNDTWIPVRDPKSGKYFFVNKLTKQKTWTDPMALQTKEWVQYTDSKGRLYYINRITRSSTWTKPDGFHEDAQLFAQQLNGASDAGTDTGGTVATAAWTKHVDPVSGRPYWTDAEGNSSGTDPSQIEAAMMKATQTDATASAVTGKTRRSTLPGADEEVWAVSLDALDVGGVSADNVKKLDAQIEAGVVKDIAEIKDFSTKKLDEHLRKLQHILKRKRNSYFIHKTLGYVEEIIDRKDSATLKHLGSGLPISVLTNIMGSPRRPEVVKKVFTVVLKALTEDEMFRGQICLEGRFWDCVFNSIRFAASRDHICFLKVYAKDEARDVPTPRHSTKQDVSAYHKARADSVGTGTSPADADAAAETAGIAIRIIEALLGFDMPIVLTAVREYSAIRDLVSCCNAHSPQICAAAKAALARLVDSATGRLRCPSENKHLYDLPELLLLARSKSSPAVVSGALEGICSRLLIGAFCPLEDHIGSGSAIAASVGGNTLVATADADADASLSGNMARVILVLAHGGLYAYHYNGDVLKSCGSRSSSISSSNGSSVNGKEFGDAGIVSVSSSNLVSGSSASSSDLLAPKLPYFKLGLKGCHVTSTSTGLEQLVTVVYEQKIKSATRRGATRWMKSVKKELVIRLPQSDESSAWCKSLVGAVAAEEAKVSIHRPASQLAEPLLRSLRLRTRMRRQTLTPRVTSMACADDKTARLMPKPPTQADTNTAMASQAPEASRCSKGREPPLLLNFDTNEAIFWAQLGAHIPVLLQLAIKCAKSTTRHQHAAAALRCVDLALNTGSTKTMLLARISVTSDYGLLSKLGLVVDAAKNALIDSTPPPPPAGISAAQGASASKAAITETTSIELRHAVVRCVLTVLHTPCLALSKDKRKVAKSIASKALKQLVVASASAAKDGKDLDITALVIAIVAGRPRAKCGDAVWPEAVLSALQCCVALCEGGATKTLQGTGMHLDLQGNVALAVDASANYSALREALVGVQAHLLLELCGPSDAKKKKKAQCVIC